MSSSTEPVTADRGALDRGVRRSWVVTVVLLLAVLVVAVVTSWVVSSRYQPISPVTDIDGDPDSGLRASPAGWVQAHQLALTAGVVLSFVWAVLTVVLVRSRGAGRIVGAALTGVATFALASVASLTWYLVAWDQAALWSVTVGTNLRGLWAVAFSDEVRFLLIGGVEVGQDTYRVWLLAHLAAPLLAAVALAAGCWIVGRPRTGAVSRAGR